MRIVLLVVLVLALVPAASAATWPPPGTTQTFHTLKFVKDPHLRIDMRACMANNTRAKILRWLSPVACEQPPRSQLLITQALFG